MTPSTSMGHYTIGISDLKVVAEDEGSITTYALGSCLGVTIHDPVAQVGGMVHVQLPVGSLDPEKAKQKPAMFVDTGVTLLFEQAFSLGANKDRLVLKVAGGANLLDDNNRFNIGQRNYQALRKLLWKNGILITAEEVGGDLARTMMLNLGTGQVTLRSDNQTREL